MEKQKEETRRVVCAVIERDGKFLCMKRKRSRKYDYISERWEFPGGKVEPGESDHEALLREIREEMRWDIYVGRKLAEFDYDYPDFTTHLAAYLCRPGDDEDTFLLLDHPVYRWLTRDEFAQLDWTAADRELLDRI